MKCKKKKRKNPEVFFCRKFLNHPSFKPSVYTSLAFRKSYFSVSEVNSISRDVLQRWGKKIHFKMYYFLFFYVFAALCMSLGICFFKHFISRRLPPVVSWGGSNCMYACISACYTVCVMKTLDLAQIQPYGFWRRCVGVSGGRGEVKIAVRMPCPSKGAGMLQDLTVLFLCCLELQLWNPGPGNIPSGVLAPCFPRHLGDCIMAQAFWIQTEVI